MPGPGEPGLRASADAHRSISALCRALDVYARPVTDVYQAFLLHEASKQAIREPKYLSHFHRTHYWHLLKSSKLPTLGVKSVIITGS